MMRRWQDFTRVLGWLVWVTSATVLSGCGVLKTMHSAHIQSSENKDAEDRQFALDPHMAIIARAPSKLGTAGPLPITNTFKQEDAAVALPLWDPHRASIHAATHSGSLIHEFGLMAAFATMAYHRHVPVSKRYALQPGQTSGANIEACTNNHDKHPLPALMAQTGALTLVTLGTPDVSGQWERWLNGAEPACVSKDDLFYETYVFRRADNGEVVDAVIAFRGTENTPGQMTSDWMDNFSAAMGFEPHQYQLAREALKKTVRALHIVNNGKGTTRPRIYAVGHSLGGGLAQMAVYTNRDILAAYAFNTSPVTDWSYLKPLGLVEVTDPVIYRIHQRGEFLGNLRAITSRVNSRRFGRSDFEFNYQADTGTFAKHSIALLACHFAGFIAKQGAETPFAFGFNRAFATALFNHNLDGENDSEDLETLCKKTIREKVCAIAPASGSELCRL